MLKVTLKESLKRLVFKYIGPKVGLSVVEKKGGRLLGRGRLIGHLRYVLLSI